MYWSAHTHSRFSVKDALTTVDSLVERAYHLDFPALGLTDHGTMAGIHQLYSACNARGMMAVPGIEAYVSDNRHTQATRAFTRHLGLLATTSEGLENLIGLNNLAHKSFNHRPVIDFADLLAAADRGQTEGIHAMTGCFFGWLPATFINAGELAARNVLVTLRKIFGDRVYVELQNHRIDEHGHSDADLVADLFGLAQQMSLPVVVTNDAHYTTPSQRKMHDVLKFMAAFGPTPEDAQFPGDGYWLCSTTTMQSRFEPHVFDAGVAGLEKILAGYDLRIPELDIYTPKIPARSRGTGLDADEQLRRACLASPRMTPKMSARLDEELAVIRTTGFAGYMLLVADITGFMRSEKIVFSTRGSASGSVVSYLLDITQVDPLEYGLLFERFLSPDRVSPPDIDLDIQHDRRKEVVDWMYANYACVQIGTWGELKLNDTGDKGSMQVMWNQAARKSGRRVAPPVQIMHELSDLEVYEKTGTHAAGILVVRSPEDLNRIPMQWIASSKTLVTALDMDDLEKAGYLKVDLLGLRTLSAVSGTAAELGIDLDEVPLDDKAVYAKIKSGNLDGAFQLSGWTTMKGCKAMKPRTFAELVHVMALYRPAAMNSGATDLYLARRAGTRKLDENVPEVIRKHLAETRGVALFQEQLISVLRDIGVDPLLLSKVLKAVKASNAKVGAASEVMEDALNLVQHLAVDAGFTQTDLEWLARTMRAYSEYSFNKAHSVAYARLAYQSVWLMVHHPAHYFAHAISAYAGKSVRVNELVSSARKHYGVRFVKPHVNYSKMDTSVTDGMVVYALTEVAGVGEAAAKEITSKAPFESVFDLASRCNSRVVTGSKAFLAGADLSVAGGVITALHNAGALDGLQKRPQQEGTQ